MPRIVGVHGIGHQFLGAPLLHRDWLPALRSGLDRVGCNLSADEDLACAFYGDLFRPKGTKSVGLPPYDASDLTEDEERELLELWWQEAAANEPQVVGPDEHTKHRTPGWLQRALNALCHSKYFAGFAERVLIADIKQVWTYLRDPKPDVGYAAFQKVWTLRKSTKRDASGAASIVLNV